MPRLIFVEFTDGSVCEMIPEALDLFLREKDMVRCFRRESGWVWVGISPLRGEFQDPGYHGIERRQGGHNRSVE